MARILAYSTQGGLQEYFEKQLGAYSLELTVCSKSYRCTTSFDSRFGKATGVSQADDMAQSCLSAVREP